MSGAKPYKRAVPPPAVYYALMAEIERNRKRFDVPMWKVDEAAGTQSGWYAHALYPETTHGRIATWASVQMLMDALFPDGFTIKIEAKKGAERPAHETHRLAIKFSGARYDHEARADWMSEIGKKGAEGFKKKVPQKRREKYARAACRAGNRKRTPERRTEIARAAANQRWLLKRSRQITQALDEANARDNAPLSSDLSTEVQAAAKRRRNSRRV